MDDGHFALPKGMTTADQERLGKKLTHFAKNLARVHVVADFDRTLTDRRPGFDEDITSWNLLRGHLPEEGQQRYRELYLAARSKELAGTMTEQDAVDWWSGVLDTYAKHGIDMNQVEADFFARATARDGAKALFERCEQLGIPTVILSAGVKEIIDLWSKHYQIYPTLTISTELEITGGGRIAGWKRDTLVHVLNKSEVDHPELNKIRSEYPFALVFGDGIGDADMAAGDEDVLRIRIYDPRPDETTDLETERARTFERFDAMIESNSLRPLVELLQRMS